MKDRNQNLRQEDNLTSQNNQQFIVSPIKSSLNQKNQPFAQTISPLMSAHQLDQNQQQHYVFNVQQQQQQQEKNKDQENNENPFTDNSLSQLELVLKIIKISLPNVFSFGSLWILNFSNLTVTETFKDENYVSAYAMSFMWANALGFALILCLNNGLCAMASQAIGFKQYNLVSSYYQRSQVLNFIFISLLTVFLFKTDAIFSLFTTQVVSDLSQRFMLGLIPSFFFYIVFDSTRNIFNAFKKFHIPNLILLFTYCFHIVWVYLFMRYFNLKMEGLGISRSITEAINALVIILVLKLKGYFKEVNFSWSKQAFKNLGGFLKYSIPMGSILYLDWIASDLQTLFVAATKDKAQFSGHSAFVSIYLLYVVLPLGISITIMTYIGQAIGKGSVGECKKIRQTALYTSIAVSTFISIVSFFLEDFTARLFTNTQGEYDNYLKCYRIYNYITIHGNAIVMSMGSIMRVSGKQNSAFFVPFICQFVIGIPLQYFMVFTLGWGVTGSWIAYTIGIYITAITFTYMIYTINWNKQIKIVQDTLEKQEKQLLEEELKGQQNFQQQENAKQIGNIVSFDHESADSKQNKSQITELSDQQLQQQQK